MKQRFIPNHENNENPAAVQPPAGAGFIDEKQLLSRLPVSRRTLFNWRNSGKIPSVRLGGRRILFHWPSVEAALLRHQRGGDFNAESLHINSLSSQFWHINTSAFSRKQAH